GWRWTPWAEIGVFDRQLVALLEEALKAAGHADSPLRARLLAALAAQLFWADAPRRRRTLGQRALEMARRVADADALGYVLNACSYALYSPELVEERLTIGTEIVGLARTTGASTLALTGHFVLMTGWLERGSTERAQQELDIFDRLAGASHQPLYRWYATEARAALATVSGRFEEAEGLVGLARDMGRRAQQPDAEIAYRGQLVTLRTAVGRIPEAQAALDGMLAGHEDLPAYTTVIALRGFLHSEAGRVTDARGEFERLAGNDFRALPRDPTWLGCVAVLAETCAFLGDAERAARLYRILRPCADRTVTTLAGSTCLGSVAHYLGVLAVTMRRWNDAEAHFEAAVRVNGAMGARPWLVRTHCAYADMLASRSATGDRERALQQLSVAITAGRELGIHTQVARADDLQRRLG
nr:hypothetical protein [Propionibacteriales bacterium]